MSRHWVRVVLVALSTWLVATDTGRAQAALVIEDLRVHGNHSTPDDEVLRIAGLTVSTPLEPGLVEAARRRLVDSDRFSSVEIRQRQRSVEDPSRIALVILVAEHPSVRPSVDAPVPTIPGVLGRLRSHTMFLPILSVEDGYGVTYGLRTTLVGSRASTARLSVPASWGGTRQLAIEAEKTYTRRRQDPAVAGQAGVPAAGTRFGLPGRRLTRLRGSAGLWRQEHPYFEQGQFRRYVHGELSHRPHPALGAGVTARVAAVAFGAVEDRMVSLGAFAEVDTRRDPLFPRNAVYARASWGRMSFAEPEASGVPGGGRSQWQHDLRGYVGVIGQVVLAARLQVAVVDAPLPAYARPILGGSDTLRGIRAGYSVGDNLWAGAFEVRAPLTSVLRSTRLGVTGFYDTGATWNHGQRRRDVTREAGVGGGIFVVNPVLQFQLSAARGLGHRTRVHVSTGVNF